MLIAILVTKSYVQKKVFRENVKQVNQEATLQDPKIKIC